MGATTIRVAVLQRVCTTYRLELFRRMAQYPGVCLKLFVGDDIPRTKVRNTPTLDGVDFVKLPTRHFGIQTAPVHLGLFRELTAFGPDVILSEGPSHKHGCLTAIRYRRSNPRTRLVYWTIGGVPTRKTHRFPPGRGRLTEWVLGRFHRYVQHRFDAFVCYSSFGRRVLEAMGNPPERIRVAVNVSDTDKHLKCFGELTATAPEARGELDLPQRFTVLYAGAMDTDKRLDVLLQTAHRLPGEQFNFVLLGQGDLCRVLRRQAEQMDLHNVFFRGHVTDELPLYYRAADVLLLPGRGGMVISEAMCHRLPVIVFQADGTEYDLVDHGRTGFVAGQGDPAEFARLLTRLHDDPDQARQMGVAAQALIRQRFNIGTMTDTIVEMLRDVCRASDESPASLSSPSSAGDKIGP